MLLEIRLPGGRRIPDDELRWTFARSAGPGGQSVNTSDTAVRLTWDVASSRAVTTGERESILSRLGPSVTLTAREHRSQWANRRAAAERLEALVAAMLAPPPPPRRPTRPSAASRRARVEAKRRRSNRKELRRRPEH